MICDCHSVVIRWTVIVMLASLELVGETKGRVELRDRHEIAVAMKYAGTTWCGPKWSLHIWHMYFAIYEVKWISELDRPPSLP